MKNYQDTGGLQVGNTGVKSLIALKKLKSLILAGCEHLSDLCLASVATMTNLESLNLMWCKVTDKGVLRNRQIATSCMIID